VKSAVETLNPTRVRLTIQVPFEELQPSLQAAYKRIAQQVAVPGFRRGKVPPPIIDRRFGREVVLEEAVNDAVPRFYDQAIGENKVQVLGRPEVDVSEFTDGSDLTFTAEVDVRPHIDLPDYRSLEVTVDDAEVADADVEKKLETLRDRFAVLAGVDRPAQAGDYISVDLVTSVDGQQVADGAAKNISYEVGSAALLEGLDEAVVGLSAGQSANFRSALRGGEHAGVPADVTVTVQSVKTKRLPELNDEFAEANSEFDTLEELRAGIRESLVQEAELAQVVQARDKVLDALLNGVDVALPSGVVKNQLDWRQQALRHQLETLGMTKDKYLEVLGSSTEQFDAEVEAEAQQTVKAQFVLDAVVAAEQLSVSEAELTDHLVRRAADAGVSPQELVQQLSQRGQMPMLVSEVVRGKALVLMMEWAKVIDASGRSIELGKDDEGETIKPSQADSTELSSTV